MILQVLVDYYETLAAQGKIAQPGWGLVKASYALYIDDHGELEQVVSVQTEQIKGKKTVLAPQAFQLPAPVKRTVNPSANFLCDNSSYILGIDSKGKPERTYQCFTDCKALHEKVLKGMDSPAARAVLAYFQNWVPAQAREHPALLPYLDDILAGANLIFRYGGGYVHEDPAVRRAWQEHYNAEGEGPEMVCLVTGKTVHAEKVHPAIKGVYGAQSSGAALVSFNAPAFWSYNREQGFNAPMGQYAAFAYTSILNHMIADREHTFRIGDTTVLFWAQNGSSAYQTVAGLSIFGSAYSRTDLQELVQKLCAGQSVMFQEEVLDPDMDFYILGLSPNASRLSVRFFLHNSFGEFLKNVQAHYDRLEIIRPAYDKFETIPLWKLLDETVNQNSRDKSPSPQLAGETLRAILQNTRYPAGLLNGVVLRIRAEREVNRGRAAILKAYYLKNAHSDVPKEVLSVSLNENSANISYTLGRLFSVLEEIQQHANPGINTTIKDKYFNSASATPAVVFPILINLAQKHLKKLDKGWRVSDEKKLQSLLNILDESLPARLSLPQQGSFQLGYYHQTQSRYQKKEEK